MSSELMAAEPNPFFVQVLANFTGLTIEVSPHTEGTAVGAGRLALVGTDEMPSVADTAEMWNPQVIVHPDDSFDRVDAARTGAGDISDRGLIPELSLDF